MAFEIEFTWVDVSGQEHRNQQGTDKLWSFEIGGLNVGDVSLNHMYGKPFSIGHSKYIGRIGGDIYWNKEMSVCTDDLEEAKRHLENYMRILLTDDTGIYNS